MKYYLINWTLGLTDYMNMYSVEVVTEDEYNSYKQRLNDLSKNISCELYYDDDEYLCLEYDDIEDILNNAQVITDIEYMSFRAMFMGTYFGDINFETIMCQIEILDDY